MIINITKENNFIIIEVKEQEQPIKFDCKTKELFSYTGRKVKHLPKVCTSTNVKFNYIRNIIEAVTSSDGVNGIKSLQMIETFLPYLDRIDSFPEMCPKGYLKYVTDNGLHISTRTVEDYLFMIATKNLTNSEKEILDFLTSHLSSYSTHKLHKMTIDDLRIFIKIVRVTMKSFQWNFSEDVACFIDKCSYNFGISNKKWSSLADTNRDLRHNIELIDNLRNKTRNENILKNESKIMAIENLSNDVLSVVVPKKMTDFIDEGKQQNNCVGSYYHDNIAQEEDLIYFIRNTSSINTSYVTCRFNIHDNSTVEARFKNNKGIGNNLILHNFIDTIDNEIRKIIK